MPMSIDKDEPKMWTNENGDEHREDGPAIIYPDGGEEWFINDKLHRIGGPALKWKNGEEKWAIDGIVHREDGPAVTHSDGSTEYWINGNKISKEQFDLKNKIDSLPMREDENLIKKTKL